MTTWFRGGEINRTPAWFAKSRIVAEFYGDATEYQLEGNILDLSNMGVDVDDEQVPVRAYTSSGEAHEWAEKVWEQLRDLGYDGVIVRQWNADMSDKPYTAMLFWGGLHSRP